MDKPISVGDLVMTVHTHCMHDALGSIFKVEIIRIGNGRRSTCHTPIGVCQYASGDGYHCPLSWLKKINPPAIEQETERATELTV